MAKYTERPKKRGRKPIAPEWVERVKQIRAAEPYLGRVAVANLLRREAEQKGRSDSPSDRVVGRIQSEFDAELSAQEQGQYKLLYWPERMLDKSLPWDASAAALELLCYFNEHMEGKRPLVRLCTWFWRVTQAAPDAPVRDRVQRAHGLAACESLGMPGLALEFVRASEWLLAYRPWRGPEALNVFENALSRTSAGMPEDGPLESDKVKFPSDLEPKKYIAAYEILSGGPLSREEREQILREFSQ
jgi:hypothetical protein